MRQQESYEIKNKQTTEKNVPTQFYLQFSNAIDNDIVSLKNT